MLAEKLNIFVIVYLDDILINAKDQDQRHVEVVWWVLDLLCKNGLFANLKKCWFHKDEVRFLRYVVSSQGIRIKDEKIKSIRNQLKPKLVQDIQVFISYTNFYWQFLQGYNRIAVPLISILKTTRSSNLALRELKGNDNKFVCVGGKVDDKNLSKSKKYQNAQSGI